MDQQQSKPQVAKRRIKVLVILLLVGIIVILGALAYKYYRFARPVGEGPAGPTVAAAPFESIWTEKKVLLLGLGDSVTAGFGVQQDLSYFNRLIRNPKNEFSDMQGLCLEAVLPNLESRNMAVSGSTSIQHLAKIEAELEPQPDLFGIVVMTSGGNDLIHNYGQTPPKEGAMYGATIEQAEPWIDNFRERLDLMLDRIDAAFPGGCIIFLADIYDPSDGVGDAPSAGLPAWPDALKILERYNAIIHEAIEQRENVVLVPMHDEFLGHGVHCTNWWNRNYRKDDPSYWYGFNLEDPNERGYDAVRRLFLNEMVDRREDIGK